MDTELRGCYVKGGIYLFHQQVILHIILMHAIDLRSRIAQLVSLRLQYNKDMHTISKESLFLKYFVLSHTYQ